MLRKILCAAALAGCASDPIAATDSATAAVVTPNAIVDVPAVARGVYPDNLGFLYDGDLASLLWLQNTVVPGSKLELENQLARVVRQGLSAEVVGNHMQVVPAMPAQPELATLAQRTTQSMRLLTQTAFVGRDYAEQLTTALHTRNHDAARAAATIAAAAQATTLLTNLGDAHPGSGLPAPAPPTSAGPVRPGVTFADNVRDGKRARVALRAHALQRAVSNRDPAAYGAVFGDLFYAALDASTEDAARAALAVSHHDSVLVGQPLDTIIAQYVLNQTPAPLTMSELRLLNQINLLSSQTALAREPLVAALLLIDLDRKQGHVDGQVYEAAIWAHVTDLTWLSAQFVRLKADGSTAQNLLDTIHGILSPPAP